MPYNPKALDTAVQIWLEVLRGDDELLFCEAAHRLATRYLTLCAEAVREVHQDQSRDLQAQSLTAWAELRQHTNSCDHCNEA